MNFSKNVKRTALSVALGMCVVGGVQAQSTTGGIYGSAPAGSTITITNNSGFNRTVTVGSDGHYNLGNLPIGAYTVDAGSVGKKNVTVTVGGAIDASFGGGDATTLNTVTVTGANVPKIDVTGTDTRSVITSEQLQRLPMGRSAEAIAVLAPGVAKGNGYYFGNSVSLGGASVAENAYYINGYFVGNPMTNVGGYTLPYGSIEQQQTLTGGYGAEYGRSDGGVINQVGKSGSNDIHFGGQVTYSPKGLRSSNPDRYYPNLDLSGANSNPNIPIDSTTGKPYQYTYANKDLVGKIYDYGDESQRWESTYSGYISGPIIKDRLFAFVSAETTKQNSIGGPSNPDGGAAQQQSRSNSDDPKIYAKLNWNINDSNLLEYTYMGEKYTSNTDYYGYDFGTKTASGYVGSDTPITQHNEISVFKYTSYITDNLTFDATYGRSRQSYVALNPQVLAGEDLVEVGAGGQDPSIVGDTPIFGPNPNSASGINSRDYTHGLRADLKWVVGDHTITGGIDNMKFEGENEGITQPVNDWQYNHTDNYAGLANYNLDGAAHNGYYVVNEIYNDATSMSLKQDAYYLEDLWQVTDNFLLSVGLRNDKFTNYNNVGKEYVESGNQWAPRVGVSWDVFGDSSFKLFANAGRYFLALPNAVAVRGASASLFSVQYSTYSGIDPETGKPIIDASGPILYQNGEDNKPVDPATIAPSNLKSEYQDEYKLGFEKTLGDSYVYGANVVYRNLKSAVDDICDGGSMYKKLVATQGQDVADGVDIPGCFIANPNASNTFSLQNVDGDGNPTGTYTSLTMNPSDWGWPSPMKRTYKALNVFFEHPFDGKWEARIDYTYSKLQGNTEGPANSDTGQGSNSHDNGVATSENWDVAAIMAYADGYLANDHKHQIKAHGSYAFTDEWMVGADVVIMSGAPANCFGYYNPDGSLNENDNLPDYLNPAGVNGSADPAGNYGSSYHTCFGSPASPGTKRLPWTHSWDFGVTYAPNYFDHKLKLGVNVFNAFNSHGTTSQGWTSETSAYTVSNTYGMPYAFQAPRYVQFSASFDY